MAPASGFDPSAFRPSFKFGGNPTGTLADLAGLSGVDSSLDLGSRDDRQQYDRYQGWGSARRRHDRRASAAPGAGKWRRA